MKHNIEKKEVGGIIVSVDYDDESGLINGPILGSFVLGGVTYMQSYADDTPIEKICKKAKLTIDYLKSKHERTQESTTQRAV